MAGRLAVFQGDDTMAGDSYTVGIATQIVKDLFWAPEYNKAWQLP